MMRLPNSGPIAQAVAGEVAWLEQHPDFHQSEGAAYKAAWDRAGSNALLHCEVFRRDCLTADALIASREFRHHGPAEYVELHHNVHDGVHFLGAK